MKIGILVSFAKLIAVKSITFKFFFITSLYFMFLINLASLSLFGSFFYSIRNLMHQDTSVLNSNIKQEAQYE